MIAFSHPWLLAAAGVWALALAVLSRLQKPALAWIDAHVAPRFRGRLTRYTAAKARRHFGFRFVAGALLATAAAGPFTLGRAKKTVESRTLLLVVDASLSMGATDVTLSPSTSMAERS